VINFALAKNTDTLQCPDIFHTSVYGCSMFVWIFIALLQIRVFNCCTRKTLKVLCLLKCKMHPLNFFVLTKLKNSSCCLLVEGYLLVQRHCCDYRCRLFISSKALGCDLWPPLHKLLKFYTMNFKTEHLLSFRWHGNMYIHISNDTSNLELI
jgi:hypothetical protein